MSKEHSDITFREAMLMLTEATDAALQFLKTPQLLSAIKQESDLLLFFDGLMVDYIHNELKINPDQFRAVLFKYSLQDESGRDHSVRVLEHVCS